MYIAISNSKASGIIFNINHIMQNTHFFNPIFISQLTIKVVKLQDVTLISVNSHEDLFQNLKI